MSTSTNTGLFLYIQHSHRAKNVNELFIAKLLTLKDQ